VVTTDNGTVGNNGDAAAVRPGNLTARWRLVSGLTARLRRVPGGLVTVGTVTAMVAAMGLTVLGLGAANNAVASYDASAWLWSTAKSEIARVNGVTGRVDTRWRVPQAADHAMQVTQTDRLLILRDLNTGQVSSLDLATLQIIATTKTTTGLGVNVALYQDAAFVVDAVQGVVRQLDPRSLVPVGEPVRFPPGITGGAFDGQGRLWIAVPSEGTVSAITAASLPSAAASSGGAVAGLSPARVRTVAVASPSHDLAISTLDSGVAVLDRTTSTLTTVRGDTRRVVTLTTAGPGALPTRTSGALVPVTVADDRHVYVVGDGGAVQQFTVPGVGARLSPAVAWAGRVYCADEQTGTLYSFDTAGRLLEKIEVRGANGPLELEVRENHLLINAPNSATARVIDDKHQVRVVDKYANDILGGDPPPVPPPVPPKKPVVDKPSPPSSVTASAGNAQARVSWGPAASNGAAIMKYVVQGANKTFDVGANQRSLDVPGLTNGQTYRFSVYAVNAKGAGPARTSNPVVPTSAVPDPPVNVTAQERPDGTVLVKWPAANGQGYKIAKYAVTAITAGTTAPAGESTKTQLVIPAGNLQYGTQYAFTVVAINEKGAGSKASPVSNTVVPFTVPDAPPSLTAATANEKGAINVSWQPAAGNGRPVTRYTVTAGGRISDVTGTSTKLTGFNDGQDITVRVRAVNEAGAGKEGTATARTIAPPALTAGGRSGTPSQVSVSTTVNENGSPTQCQLSVSQGGRSAATGWGACATMTIGVWRSGTNYNFTLTARNAAGQSSYTGSVGSSRVTGQVSCNDGGSGYCINGVGIYRNSRQQSGEAVGSGRNGDTYDAWCKKPGTAGNQGGPTLKAAGYNNNKTSSWWVQITFAGGANYIPFIWLNLNNGDNIGALPDC
jgi:hypothetical protein